MLAPFLGGNPLFASVDLDEGWKGWIGETSQSGGGNRGFVAGVGLGDGIGGFLVVDFQLGVWSVA